jgi:hypothetical protein
MESKELSIETVQVEIKVIRVGGHKMTAAVFEQIRDVRLFELLGLYDWHDLANLSSNARWDKLERRKKNDQTAVLGWVHRRFRECGNFLLWAEYGELFKTPLGPFDMIRTTENEQDFLELVQNSYPQLYIAT